MSPEKPGRFKRCFSSYTQGTSAAKITNRNCCKALEDIVKSQPADYFRAGDLPLLQSYCAAFNRKNQIDLLIIEHGVMFEGEPHPGLKISRDEAALMASLAVKLRLCPSSRTRSDKASLQTSHNERKPWDVLEDAER